MTLKRPALKGQNFIQSAKRRSVLWGFLVALVLLLLAALVWLASAYENSNIENRLERDALEAVLDIKGGLNRNIQSLQALHAPLAKDQSLDDWQTRSAQLLREQREIMRVEWRTDSQAIKAYAGTPFRPEVFERFGRSNAQADVNAACNTARRVSGAAYSTSYFVPQTDGLGMELVDMCLPLMAGGQLTGFIVATYALQGILSELVSKQLTRGQSLAFTEADGTRLALLGGSLRGNQSVAARQLLDLPGMTVVLRLESRLGTPGLFPNVLTALLAAMSLALLAVLFLLAHDTRKRLAVEHDLGEALAFRKAMEDSLLTGLRARDLLGRTTYVNPAFCQMVGLTPQQLLNQSLPAPYWPPELSDAYGQRQAIRLAGNNLPREGHESVFIKPDGTRFEVLIIEAPLINAVGKHTGWMSAILDVSQQRRSEELSRASQDRLQATARLAMVGEMASLLSHELNQPLAAISSYAVGSLNLLEGTRTTTALPAEVSTDLQLAIRRIAEQAERAGRVIKSVHNFVRRREQAHVAVQPRALFDAIMPLVSLQAQKLQVLVVMDIAADAKDVYCDRTMVEQVLLNLARNGMQAMQDNLKTGRENGNRVLTLRVRPKASNAARAWVEFAVIDEGAGISAEVQAKLFTPFFTTRAEGMGLGLSLCRTVIEQHGGFLDVQSAVPHGSVFSFTLPAASA